MNEYSVRKLSAGFLLPGLEAFLLIAIKFKKDVP
jgi:hypothetical protein